MIRRPIILHLLIWVFVILFFTSCSKQENEFVGSASAIKNGKSWNSDCISGYSNQQPDEIFITMRVYSTEGFLRETLGIGRIIPSIGIYEVEKPIADSTNIIHNNNYSFFATSIDDGDVGDKFYDVLETENNFIDIKSIDYDKMLISGSFEITFILSDTLSEPDTLRFIGGEFEAEIREDW